MRQVGIKEGIGYGLRAMLYYIGVVVVGNVTSGIGFAIMTVGWDGFEPNFGMILFGFLIALAGVLLLFAGIFGALYKIIADSVAKGRVMSSSAD